MRDRHIGPTATAGNGGSGKMIELLCHVVARLDDVLVEHRAMNRRLNETNRRLDQVVDELRDVKAAVHELKEEVHGINVKLDSAAEADRHIRLRVEALEAWARGQGFTPSR